MQAPLCVSIWQSILCCHSPCLKLFYQTLCICDAFVISLVYWHQRADERHGNPPQGNQELLVVRYKVGELGVSKSMECDFFPSVLWDCWLGDRKGNRPVKKLDVGLLVVMIWVELRTTCSCSSPVVTTTSIILCFNKHWLTLENGR